MERENMKAISIKEPWASLIHNGSKTIETRTWGTKYRGKILLCASKSPISQLSGHAFATADLIDIQVMTEHHELAAMCEVYEGAKAWILENIKPIEPIKVTGALGLFEVVL